MLYKITFLVCLLLNENSVNAAKQNRLLVKSKPNDNGDRHSRDITYTTEDIEPNLEVRIYDDDINLDEEIKSYFPVLEELC